MTSIRKAYLTVAALTFAALAAGCALGPPSQQAQTSAASQVVDDYKVSGLLAQSGPAISDSLSRNLPDSVDDAQRQALDAAVARTYDPQRLRNTVVSRLADAAATSDNQKYLINAAAELNKPLPQRMIGLESRVADPNFGDGFQAFQDNPATPERQQRLEIIEQLSDDMVVGDLQTDFNVALLESMIAARNDVVSPDEQVDAAQKQRIIANSRDGIRAKLNQQVPRMLLYVYRDVDTKTLQQYADLQHQPFMVWSNKALANAVTSTLADAGPRVAQNLSAEEQ